jgi:hypothetical protein
MILLALLIGLGLPALLGWVIVRLCEGARAAMTVWERAALAWILGITASMFLLFATNAYGGMPLHALPMVGVLAVASAAIALALRVLRVPLLPSGADAPPLPGHALGRRWIAALRVLLGLSGVKIVLTTAVFLLLMPPTLDDVIENWNLRAKVFLNDRTLTLILPGQQTVGMGVNAYPPTVPLAKTWLLALAGGQWNEALANGLHILWFAAAAALLYGFLRRTAGLPWALLGAYVFCSLPLVVMHAASAYADIFIAGHVLAAATMAASALGPKLREDQRIGFLKLAGVALALLAFTKNEGLLIYLPPAAIAMAATIAILALRRDIRASCTAKAVIWAAACAAIVVVPWISFKWSHGLAFGNAKGITDVGFAFEPRALYAIFINTFLEGNWLLLPGLLVLLLAARGVRLLHANVLPLSILCIIPFLGQIGIFTMTGLSSEAIMQTGYARGLVQITPLGVILAVLLIRDLLAPKQHDEVS